VAVKIKLARFGKIREPFYRVVVADARTRRSGRAIEAIGKYHPKAEPSVIELDSERVQYWLGVGAQPTESVLSLLKVTGDWQKFKGEPGAEGTLQVAPTKRDKRSVYEAAVAAIGGNEVSSATTPRKKAPKKAFAADDATDAAGPTGETSAAEVSAPQTPAAQTAQTPVAE